MHDRGPNCTTSGTTSTLYHSASRRLVDDDTRSAQYHSPLTTTRVQPTHDDTRSAQYHSPLEDADMLPAPTHDNNCHQFTMQVLAKFLLLKAQGTTPTQRPPQLMKHYRHVTPHRLLHKQDRHTTYNGRSRADSSHREHDVPWHHLNSRRPCQHDQNRT